MSPLPKPAYWAISISLIVLLFVLLMPSVIGCLLSLLLVMAWADFNARRRTLAARTFNSAVRAVCGQEGAVSKVAVAFSRSGPLSGPCYEYARRLMLGENPVDAAADVGIPLQLSTAIALEIPAGQTQPGPSRDMPQRDLLSHDSGSMPAYGQMFYLLMTAFSICAVITWITVQIIPDMWDMMEEFEVASNYMGKIDTAPAFLILAVLVFVVLIVIPVLNRGQLFGIRYERFIPILPAVARRRGETLYGLADAMDAGIPMGRALSIGHSITLGRVQRRRLEDAMRGISQGLPMPKALERAGLIGSRDQLWLRDETPERTAELLRAIADQDVRDADSNSRALMSVVFPVVILALGAAVFGYCNGFLGALMDLVSGQA